MSIYKNINRSEIQFDFVVHGNSTALRPLTYVDEAKALGANIYTLPVFNGLNYFSYQRAWRKFLKQHPGYDAVHIHVTNFSFAFLPVLKEIPMRILHAHSNSDVSFLRRVVVRLTQRYIMARATHYLAASQLAADFTYGKNAENVKVFPNPIDVRSFAYNAETRQQKRAELGLENAFVIGHVARFYEVKNHPFLFQTMKALQQVQPNAVLLLVGDGPLYEEMKKKAEEMGVQAQFLYVRKDVPELMQAMDVTVMPSLFEGLCNAVVEAQSAGLPCILSDRLPKEAALIPELVKFLPIDTEDAAQQWAQAILSYRDHVRENTYDAVCAFGFDAETQARVETELYLKGV